MTTRQQRRQEERKARKAALKSGKAIEVTEATAAAPEATASSSSTDAAIHRAEVNRKNAQHSTGPRTAEGKSTSSQNAFKHGLYSKQLVLPGEDPAELDALRADLRREHQPATTTEDILVNELAEHYCRMRKFEARAMSADNFETGLAILPIIQRTMAAAERGFHKALKTLTDLQRQRGFVPQIQPTEAQPIVEPAQSESRTHPISEPTSSEMHPKSVELPLDTPEPHYQSAA